MASPKALARPAWCIQHVGREKFPLGFLAPPPPHVPATSPVQPLQLAAGSCLTAGYQLELRTPTQAGVLGSTCKSWLFANMLVGTKE